MHKLYNGSTKILASQRSLRKAIKTGQLLVVRPAHVTKNKLNFLSGVEAEQFT